MSKNHKEPFLLDALQTRHTHTNIKRATVAHVDKSLEQGNVDGKWSMRHLLNAIFYQRNKESNIVWMVQIYSWIKMSWILLVSSSLYSHVSVIYMFVFILFLLPCTGSQANIKKGSLYLRMKALCTELTEHLERKSSRNVLTGDVYVQNWQSIWQENVLEMYRQGML